jgi:hypothetical protein
MLGIVNAGFGMVTIFMGTVSYLGRRWGTKAWVPEMLRFRNGRELACYSRMPKEVTRCPLCDSQYIRVSHSKRIFDFFVRLFLDKVPFRCRKCRLRFYMREPQVSTAYFREAASVRQWTQGLHNRTR